LTSEANTVEQRTIALELFEKLEEQIPKLGAREPPRVELIGTKRNGLRVYEVRLIAAERLFAHSHMRLYKLAHDYGTAIDYSFSDLIGAIWVFRP
jgi:hypothetical protein